MYPKGKYFIIGSFRKGFRPAPGALASWFAWILAMLILVSAGIIYRAVASVVSVDSSINLEVPLSRFPERIGNWVGMELQIPTITREYMEKNFADDYISRRYTNELNNDWADIYVVYCSSRPGGMLGHRPRVCYPGNGWIHDNTEESEFISSQGREIPCLIHRFHKPAPSYEKVIILNFYIVNGKLETDGKSFSSIWSRRFNLRKDPARYVAQIQVSSKSENSIRKAAEDMTELIIHFLPDKESKTGTGENLEPEQIQ